MDEEKKQIDYKKVFSTKYKNESIIRKMCPKATHKSGIYVFYRQENGFKYAYVGLATKSVLSRLAEHLSGFDQHIDKSIRKHKLYSTNNQTGYKIDILCYCTPEECNEKEQYYIKKWANAGWQMRNKTSGSQGEGKAGIADNKESKGYRDGLKQGYNNARKEVAHWFDLHLDCTIKGKSTKNKEKALEKFKNFINFDKKDESLEENQQI